MKLWHLYGRTTSDALFCNWSSARYLRPQPQDFVFVIVYCQQFSNSCLFIKTICLPLSRYFFVTTGVAVPTLRPSLRQALQPEAIEETVVRCVVSHLGLSKSVQGLELLQATETQAEEFSFLCDVMSEVFIRLNALIRQLQTMAEMEKKWAHELDDVRGAVLQPSAAFFNDFHLQEVFPYQRSFLTFFQLSWAICFF